MAKKEMSITSSPHLVATMDILSGRILDLALEAIFVKFSGLSAARVGRAPAP